MPISCALAQQNAELWDVSVAPTIVMTQRGARQHFQSMLRSKGVEVVEFDFLTPENVADYCYDRGFLQVRVGDVWGRRFMWVGRVGPKNRSMLAGVFGRCRAG